jgi:hypothetical protein
MLSKAWDLVLFLVMLFGLLFEDGVFCLMWFGVGVGYGCRHTTIAHGQSLI